MTVTYGTTSAPYLAIRCLRQLAKEAEADLPIAAQALKKDCYMDDVLTGARTIQEASPLKTLGLRWDSNKDCLQYQVESLDEHKITKRNVLSKVAQVFDPLGLVGPVLITGKIIMQQLWVRQIEWDQQIPPDLSTTWCDYYKALPKLNELIIPRNINPRNESESFDIIGFSDFSEKALGACLYAVSKDEDQTMSSQLICSKSKVAPVKAVSLPRLELMAASLLAELVYLVRKTYEEKIREITLFSDSTITLGWIKSKPNDLKTFVANRVTKIQELTNSATWRHTPSLSNPADMLSRGIAVQDILENKLWWNGPSWIIDKNQWPSQPITIEPDLSEMKVSLTVTKEEDIFLLSSNYSKLINIIAYCLRIKRFSQLLKSNSEEVKMLRKERVIPPLSVKELESAEQVLARKSQQQTFSKEIVIIQRKQELHKRCPLTGLNPFIDDKGLLRVLVL
ncbi:uncharacterized protein LOC122511943 [Leptopilina heterotoma]|uniref:uncharacterized protein LOC122511943 n=1 Tax=Leptopilina heterotoma TaxID=63436 RepID=UPI001CA7E3D8|nr:uncharacterized protein LOC122511943 [Leptopilina heterotoma]